MQLGPRELWAPRSMPPPQVDHDDLRRYIGRMTSLRFSLRGLLVATAAIGALLASAVVENKIATAMIALIAATALTAAVIRGRGYLQTFCLGALIPAGLMCWFVAYEAAKHMGPLNASPMGANPLTGTLYFMAFCDAFYIRVRYVVFSFGLASIAAGSTAVATHWLMTGAGDEDLPLTTLAKQFCLRDVQAKQSAAPIYNQSRDAHYFTNRFPASRQIYR